jgi:hypothetical protein
METSVRDMGEWFDVKDFPDRESAEANGDAFAAALVELCQKFNIASICCGYGILCGDAINGGYVTGGIHDAAHASVAAHVHRETTGILMEMTVARMMHEQHCIRESQPEPPSPEMPIGWKRGLARARADGASDARGRNLRAGVRRDRQWLGASIPGSATTAGTSRKMRPARSATAPRRSVPASLS